MKRNSIKVGAFALALFAGFAFTTTNNATTSTGGDEILAIGKAAPEKELKMKDVSGKELSLEDISEENGLLVVFSCNTCPFVVGSGESNEGWEGRYNAVYDMASKQKIGMVLINSNEAKREGVDSFEEMKGHAKTNKYKSHYVEDTNHKLADAFGAKTTPHVFLFDKNMKLVYKGAIDDNVKDSKAVKEEYLKDAMNNLAAGKKISPNSTRQLGCSIKRVKS
jgi:hypothetical protein